MNRSVKKLAYAAMFAVLNYVAFAYAKISIPTSPTSSTAIHLANAVVVLSAWALGPVYGGLAGAIGLSIADFMDPRYIASAPKTFLMKFMIGFIAGKVAEMIHLDEENERNGMLRKAAISAASGLGFNVVFDPIIGYFYKKYLLKVPAEAMSIIMTWSAGITALNGVICLIAAVILYLSLYKYIRGMKQ